MKFGRPPTAPLPPIAMIGISARPTCSSRLKLHETAAVRETVHGPSLPRRPFAFVSVIAGVAAVAAVLSASGHFPDRALTRAAERGRAHPPVRLVGVQRLGRSDRGGRR